MAILAAIGEERQSNPVVSVANDLAKAYDDDLHVLHVIPEEDFQAHRESMADLPGEYSTVTVEQEQESAQRFARAVVEETLGEFKPARVTAVGRVGDPVDTIISVANDLDARYVVIGGRRRSPAGKAIFGSRTQSVLLESTTPVVTVMTDE